VGELKGDDLPPEALLESYGYMVESIYPTDRVLLSPLPLAMRYAGPKAAVLLAIIRKNYGCTHFIVGRDIAGVGSYYDPYGAHELMRDLDLGIEPMFFKGVLLLQALRLYGHREDLQAFSRGPSKRRGREDCNLVIFKSREKSN